MIDEKDLGVMERTADGVAIRYTRRLPHPPEKVWRALTEDQHLKAWFPTTIEGEWVAGAPLLFNFREQDFPGFDGCMRTVDPPRVLSFLWGDEELRFELVPETEGTLLRFTAMFPAIGKAARDGAGWHECLDRMVADMDGVDRQHWVGDGWEVLAAIYRKRFGPEASTEGPPEGWKED